MDNLLGRHGSGSRKVRGKTFSIKSGNQDSDSAPTWVSEVSLAKFVNTVFMRGVMRGPEPCQASERG
jgi:hypothetical protein